MSSEDAQAFFSSFFGGSDPFGGAGLFSGNSQKPGGGIHMNIGGMPVMSGGGIGQGGMDPFSMMFSGSMPGMGTNVGGTSVGGMYRGMDGGIPGGTHRHRQHQSRQYDSIPSGTVVSLKGLVNAPDRNGDQGVIKSYSPSNGRYIVVIDDTDEPMSVKPSNLLQHLHVRIHGLKTQTELNGQKGTIVTRLPTKERYNIYIMTLKKVVSLKLSNVVLDDGSVGQIHGLKSKPELNGKWGTVKCWIRDLNKYDVQLSEHQVIRIKTENMQV